jgi:hypothetical protein
MKQQTYSVLVNLSWGIFFINMWGIEPSIWSLISLYIAFSAVYFTVELHATHVPEVRSERPVTFRSWVVAVCWGGLLLIFAANLTPYWSQLCPLLGIGALYCASRIWPACKPEDNPHAEAPQSIDS